MKPKVVLAVGAHPDDIDFGAGGTLAVFAAQGAKVYYLQLTDGGSGSSDPATKRSRLAKLRQEEQRNACECIGGEGVEFLKYSDGALENSMAVKTCIVKSIRRLKPDVVVTIDPTMVYAAELGIINHPDHRAAGQATLDAVYPLARDHLSIPKLYKAGLAPHKVKTVLLINFNVQNFYVDISSTLETKLEAVRAHASQIGDPAAMSKLFTQQAADQGKQAGYDYAEGFIRIDVTP